MKKNKYDLLILLKDLKKNRFVSKLATLNTEQKKIKKVHKELGKMMRSCDFSQDQIFSSASMQQVSKFRNDLNEKIEISRNRKNHLSKEIKGYLTEINKIDRQKDKIFDKKKQLSAIRERIEDSKNDLNFKMKNI